MAYPILRYMHLLGLTLMSAGLIGVWYTDLRSRQVRDLPVFAEAVRQIAVFYDCTGKIMFDSGKVEIPFAAEVFRPLTALRFAEICQEAGLPEGVFNVVTGPGGKTGMASPARPRSVSRS